MEHLLTHAEQPTVTRPAWRASRTWPRWFRYTLPGSWGALLFACLAFTPSLLPRSGPFQGFVSGLSAAIGYGLGCLGAWL